MLNVERKKNTKKVLLVDDEAIIHKSLSRILEKYNIEIISAYSVEEACKLLSEDYSLAIVDMRMPGENGLDFLKYSKKNYPNLEVAVLTGFGEAKDTIEYMSSGAACFLSKSKVGNDEFIKNIIRTIKHSKKKEVFPENKEMIEEQLISKGIRDKKLISAFESVPRHYFVPIEFRKRAYSETAIPIGFKQTTPQPFVIAKMIELLNLSGSEKVLEVGTGSGYQTAILSHLAKEVFSAEIINRIAIKGKELLHKLNIDNVFIKNCNGLDGWNGAGSFDAIIVTGASPTIPRKLIMQLKPGGRMVIPVGEHNQELLLITREGNSIKKEIISSVSFQPLIKNLYYESYMVA